jgi:hypothetical protein
MDSSTSLGEGKISCATLGTVAVGLSGLMVYNGLNMGSMLASDEVRQQI